ncbi:MAG: hypothetical protein IPL61_00300 [Myxococcales bacterium]|nr:hypothetical protein [Myxococcales bacterium]
MSAMPSSLVQPRGAGYCPEPGSELGAPQRAIEHRGFVDRPEQRVQIGEPAGEVGGADRESGLGEPAEVDVGVLVVPVDVVAAGDQRAAAGAHS